MTLPTGDGAPATLADLDGDGRLEIIVPTGSSLDAFAWTGLLLQPRWSTPLAVSGCCGGASAFDLDGDGAVEPLYRGARIFYVVDGLTGAVLDERGVGGGAGFPSWLGVPVVADIDNDGLPEIVVAHGAGSDDGSVTAYECGVPVPARCIWNQHCYHVTNVNDDGTIPRVEVAPWTAGFSPLEQEGRACCVRAQPDLFGWALRASHVADVVTMLWPASRGLLSGEHYHVLKSYDAPGFAMINGEGQLSRAWTETDTSRPLQFFDIRIADACEVQSVDDEPPGWDVPH